MNKKISVILVNYNGAQDTIECIKSLKESIKVDLSIIVVDNYSTDDSVKLLEDVQKLHSFKLLKSKVNRGFSAGNNIGIKYIFSEKIPSDYVMLLNNDTIVNKYCLFELINSFQRHEACGVTIGTIFYESKRDIIWYAGGSISKNTARVKHWNYQDKVVSLINHDRKVTFATGCCMCFSYEVLKEVGFMDEDYFLYEEDSDYSIRIRKIGYEIYYIPSAVLYHKVGASTGKKSFMSQYYLVRNKYFLIKKHYSGLYKVLAYFAVTLQYAIRCLKKEISYKVFVEAYNAYKSGETGKTQIFN